MDDYVLVDVEKIDDLKYVPNFPESIKNTTGTITSTWRLDNTREKYVTVRLDEALNVPNLQFHVDNLTLLIPSELVLRLAVIEKALGIDIYAPKG